MARVFQVDFLREVWRISPYPTTSTPPPHAPPTPFRVLKNSFETWRTRDPKRGLRFLRSASRALRLFSKSDVLVCLPGCQITDRLARPPFPSPPPLLGCTMHPCHQPVMLSSPPWSIAFRRAPCLFWTLTHSFLCCLNKPFQPRGSDREKSQLHLSSKHRGILPTALGMSEYFHVLPPPPLFSKKNHRLSGKQTGPL